MRRRALNPVRCSVGRRTRGPLRLLKMMDGEDHFSIVIWKMPPDKIITDVTEREKSQCPYLQSGGSVEAMVLEERSTGGRDAQQWALGHTPREDDATVAITVAGTTPRSLRPRSCCRPATADSSSTSRPASGEPGLVVGGEASCRHDRTHASPDCVSRQQHHLVAAGVPRGSHRGPHDLFAESPSPQRFLDDDVLDDRERRGRSGQVRDHVEVGRRDDGSDRRAVNPV